MNLGRSLPPLIAQMRAENPNIALLPAFINFVHTREMGAFINSKGVEWVARSAVHVLDKINAMGMN